MIALHGSGGDGARIRHFTAGAFDRLADRHGFIVAYPDALGGQWNDCRERAPHHAALRGVDDTAFLREVVEFTAKTTGHGFSKVYVVGFSNGGHMVLRLTLEAPNVFDAYAVIGAHLPHEQERACEAAGHPVSIMLISGDEDPINPWNGGEVISPFGESLGQVISANATAGYFRDLAGLNADPEIHRFPDVNPYDGSRVLVQQWGNQFGTRIELMVVEGGGHSLPHPTAHFPEAILGPTNRDVNGAKLIWDFFSHQSGSDTP